MGTFPCAISDEYMRELGAAADAHNRLILAGWIQDSDGKFYGPRGQRLPPHATPDEIMAAIDADLDRYWESVAGRWEAA